jgi:hypothetical protein
MTYNPSGIFSQPPSKLVKWGNFILLFIAFSLFSVTYFVRLPETISGNIEIFIKNDFRKNLKNNSSFYGIAKINIKYITKIYNGQRVIVKLNDLPFQEYGVWEGEIVNLSKSSDSHMCQATILLFRNEKITNFILSLPFYPDFSGNFTVILKNDRAINLIIKGLNL